ncbi:MAG: hypothetical protein WC322_06675 [Candidatus Paceibacterota bacterium]|jgi:hypothetical protein
MTDEGTRIARLEERMEDTERWIRDHKDLGVDVSLLKHCVKTYNGSIKSIDKKVDEMSLLLSGWMGGMRTLKWIVSFVGAGLIVNIVLSALGY